MAQKESLKLEVSLLVILLHARFLNSIAKARDAMVQDITANSELFIFKNNVIFFR